MEEQEVRARMEEMKKNPKGHIRAGLYKRSFEDWELRIIIDAWSNGVSLRQMANALKHGSYAKVKDALLKLDKQGYINYLEGKVLKPY